jgi:protein TonB
MPAAPKAEPVTPRVEKPAKSSRKPEVAERKPPPRAKKRPVPPKKKKQEREKKAFTQIESTDPSAEQLKDAVKTDTVKDAVSPSTSEGKGPPSEASTRTSEEALFDDIPSVDDSLWGAYKSTSPEPPGAASPAVKEAKPDYQQNPAPEYPSRARRRGYEGTVTLKVLVDRNGGVAELEIYESSGYRMLDRAALRAVKTWRFIPGSKGNRTIDMWVMIPVRFELRAK